MLKNTSIVFVAVVAILALTLIGGCGKQPIAQVGNSKITRDEFIAKMEKEVGKDLLVNMIDQRLVEDAATAAGITVTPEDVKKELDKAKEQSGGPEQFAKMLETQNMTEEDANERLTYTLKVKALLTKDVKADEESLKKFFEQYKAQFAKPETVKYSEIVVATKADADKVLSELKKQGADFGTIAKQNSISPMTRERNGSVGPVPRQAIYPAAVRDAMAKAKVGEIAQPIEADGRWYIIKLEEIKPEEKPDFAKQRSEIEELFKMQQAKSFQDLLQELRADAKINIIDPAYQSVNDMFKPKEELPQFGAPDAKGGAAPAPAPEAGQVPPAEGGK